MSSASIVVLGVVATVIGRGVHQLVLHRTWRPLIAKSAACVAVICVAVVGHSLLLSSDRHDAVARVDAELRNVPPFQALRDVDPRAYAELKVGIQDGVERGLSSHAIAAQISERASAAVHAYLPEAADADIVAMFESEMAEVAELEAKDRDVAFRFLFPRDGETVDPTPYVTEATRQRALMAAAAVIRSGAAHSAANPDVARARVLLHEAVAPLQAEHGAALLATRAPHEPGVDRHAVVDAVAAMYAAVLQLPSADAALVLRHMTAGIDAPHEAPATR